MLKCFYCGKLGKTLEKCLDCQKTFHKVCRKNFRDNASENCCEIEEKVSSTRKECHRCLSQKMYDQFKICSSSSCGKSFCSRCIKYRYKENIKDLEIDWECYACNKACPCKVCRKSSKSRQHTYALLNSRDVHNCHNCEKKVINGKYSYCKVCSNFICLSCLENYYKNLETCPICLDLCDCTTCGRIRFDKDFPDFAKGVDMRELYPHDVDNLLYVNGFWVRNINL